MSRIALAVSFLLLSSAAVQAQTSRPANRGKVHRMEILSGGTQNVRYFGTALTPDESSTLRDLERLENEAIYARNLISLKQQYVLSERLLEPQRRLAQTQLYGIELAQLNTPLWLPYGYAGTGYYRGYAPGMGYGYGYTGGYGLALASGAATPLNYGVGTGMVYDSPVKDALSRVMAQQATPEYYTALERAYDRAALRATASVALRRGLNYPEPADTRRERETIRVVSGESDRPTSPVVLTLKTGEKISGKRMKEDKEWVTLERAEGGRVRIRMSEIMRIDETSTSGIKPSSE